MSDMKNLAVTYFNRLLNDHPKATIELIDLLRELYNKYEQPLIDEEEKSNVPFITLNKEDGEAFMKTLLNPPEPNEALLKAAKRYKEIIEGE